MTTTEKNVSKDARDSGPWWREPWPWILMAGPAVAVVGCIITIVLAFQNVGNQPVDDGGVKRGLVVSKSIQAPAPKEPQE